jgi:tyrosine-protein phosphatase YwqE
LIQTDSSQEPFELEETIYSLNNRQIIPLLANPENNKYLQTNFDRAISLFRMGARFKVNWKSFHYLEDGVVQKLVKELIDYRMVSFLGTNLRKENQIQLLIEATQQYYFQLLTETGLANNKLA